MLTWCIITLGLATSSSNIWLTLQAKNNARSAPELLKSRTEAIMCVPQIIIYTVREKGMEYKGEQG